MSDRVELMIIKTLPLKFACLESIFSFFLDDRTFEEYSGWNITMLQKNKKKTFEYVYFLNDTAATTPTVDSIVQTDYQKTEIGSYVICLIVTYTFSRLHNY